MRVPGNTTQAKQHAARLLPAIVAGVLLTAAAADVHSQTRCVFLCAPELKIEPTLTIENTRMIFRTAGGPSPASSPNFARAGSKKP